MKPDLIKSARFLFSSSKKKLEMKTRDLAEETTQNFDNLQKIIKLREHTVTDYKKATDKMDQFLQDNTSTLVDRNVTRNTDNKRAQMLLTGVMLIGCILSVKGLKFFFGEFYASISLLMIIPIALTLAGVFVLGSIYINNFSNQYHGVNNFIFIQLKTAAYSLVLFIPSMNLLEGFDSNYRPVVMALNAVGCIIDIVLHTSLVSMSKVFIVAEDSNKALKKMRIMNKELKVVDNRLRAFNETFMNYRIDFSNSAKHFVSSFKELQTMNPNSASNTLFLLDNFTIWMINNRVMQHALIPYHADKKGHPVIELNYFTSEQDTFRQSWDSLSMVKVDSSYNQDAGAINDQNQLTELPQIIEPQQSSQDQSPFINNNDNETVPLVDPIPQMNYEDIFNESNQNDKIL